MLKKILSLLIVFIISLNMVLAFDTLSLSRIDFNSNDPEVRGPAFILYNVENGRSDYAEYKISNLESAAKADGVELSGSGTIKSELTDYKIEYPIINTGVPLLEMNLYTTKTYIPFYHTEEKLEEWCDGAVSPTAYFNFWVRPAGSIVIYCWEIQQTGVIGEITDSPTTLFEDTIKVEVTGKTTEVVKLSNQNRVDSTSHVVAKFTGMLGNVQETPDIGNNYGAVFTSSNVYLVKKNFVDAYRVYIKDGDLRYSQWYDDIKLDMTNGYATFSNVADLPQAQYTSYNNNIQMVSANTGKFVLENTPIYQYPSFTLKINADWVGIYQPVGRPEIVNVESDCFTTGASGKVTAKIKNAGTEDASFDIGMVCDSGFSPFSLSSQKFLKGQTRDIDIFMTAFSDSKSEGKCTLIVKDSSNPKIQDSVDNINVCVKTAITCSPKGAERCVGDNREVCTTENDVNVWRPLENCDGTCEYIDKYTTACNEDGDVCVIDDDCPNGYVCQDGGCKKINFNWWSFIASFIVGLGLAAFLGSKIKSMWEGNTFTKVTYVIILIIVFLIGFILVAQVINFFTSTTSAFGKLFT